MLRIGILGAAKIARLFTTSVEESNLVRVAAVASRDLAKAQAFAAEYGIPKALGSYEALLADPNIDAIYNPLPNGLHAEWSVKAAQAGKHVLCEKPLASNAAEVTAMFAAAKANNVIVAEGFPYLAQPQTIELRRQVAQGVLGELRLMQAGFSFTLANPNDIRFNAALAGGALMDLGCYTVSLMLLLAAEMKQTPVSVQAVADYASSGVDKAMAGTITFTGQLQGQLLGQFNVSLAAARHRYATIVGTTGVVHTPFYNDTSDVLPPTFTLRTAPEFHGTVQTIQNQAVLGFRAQADEFADLVAHGWETAGWHGATPAQSLLIAQVMDALKLSASSGRVVMLRD